MRILIDTNIFLYKVSDIDSLSSDVQMMLDDYSNLICMSVESLRELVVLFNNGKIVTKTWKTAHEMLQSVKDEYFIDVLPLDANVMDTYSRLRLNTAQDHRDPSDHVIISHAITIGIPLISSDRKFPFYRSQGLELIENLK
jgi:PIN domain nuclease of toxin-antitoxin system